MEPIKDQKEMHLFSIELQNKILFTLLGLILIIPNILVAQISESDSIAMTIVVNDFRESIAQKDSTRFYDLFFSEYVDFTGIMSEKTEWSIKKDYPEFQGIAVSNHKIFIQEICQTPKRQEEKFHNIFLSSDGNVGAISFDYAFYTEGKMIQWGDEKWNLVKDGGKWLITDVVYSIHFPSIEPYPF